MTESPTCCGMTGGGRRLSMREIPAFAGMTWEGAGNDGMGVGMTWEGAGNDETPGE